MMKYGDKVKLKHGVMTIDEAGDRVYLAPGEEVTYCSEGEGKIVVADEKGRVVAVPAGAIED